MSLPNDEHVTLTRAEYDELVDDQNMLRLLRAAGVDNWEGYEFALSEGFDD